MAWRDELQPASFRNVPFKVASTNGQLGRRTVIHEYPSRDLPYAEDLGRKAREFSIEAFVIGADYMTLRDDLIYALELPGSGELVHPFRGRQQVVLTSASVSESTDEGGMAKFSLSFTESGEPLNPARKVDTAQVVETAADEADAELESDFFDWFNVDGLLDFVDLEALSVVGDALSAVADAVSTVSDLASSALNQVNGVMSEFTLQAARISSGLSSLIRLPGNLAGSLMGQIHSLSAMGGGPLRAFNSLRRLFGFGNDYPQTPATSSVAWRTDAKPKALVTSSVAITPSRQQQANNQIAVINLIRCTAVVEACRVATKIQPDSYQQAVALRDELSEQLELMADTAPDPVYRALMKLRIAVINHIDSQSLGLLRTVQYPVPTTEPALVTCYRLYGALPDLSEQVDRLVSRNGLHHPGFVPGGESIEVVRL